MLIKEMIIKHHNEMIKRYNYYLDTKTRCYTCKYYKMIECYGSCKLSQPEYENKNRDNQCQMHKIDKYYKRAIKYIERKTDKNDKNKIN